MDNIWLTPFRVNNFRSRTLELNFRGSEQPFAMLIASFGEHPNRCVSCQPIRSSETVEAGGYVTWQRGACFKPPEAPSRQSYLADESYSYFPLHSVSSWLCKL